MDDMELLQGWVDHGSEDAFRSIVERHVNLTWNNQMEPRNTRPTRKQNGLEEKMNSPSG